MTKRRDIIKALEDAGFRSEGGTNHEKFRHPDGRQTVVPRHREIPNLLEKVIRKQAGLE